MPVVIDTVVMVVTAAAAVATVISVAIAL